MVIKKILLSFVFNLHLMLKPEGKGPLGRSRYRWDGNIKIDLQEVGCGAWTGSSWLRIGTGGGQL